MKSITLLAFLTGAATGAFAQASVSQLANLSSRGLVGSGAGGVTAGFVVGGNAPEHVLIRGTGPGLAAFGDPNPAAAVTVNIYDAAGNLVATDDGTAPDPLAAQAATAVGAFAQSGAGDSALLTSLAPGAYTIEIAPNAADAPAGDALLEVYALDAPGTGGAFANLSTRAEVGATAGTMISGFVVSGTASKNLLIRGVGADLAAFGVANAAPAVGIAVYDATGRLVASNQGYLAGANTAGVVQTAAAVGAFPLADPGDSALVASLPPGAYTVELSPASVDAPDAVGLLEVYDADAAMPPPAPIAG